LGQGVETFPVTAARLRLSRAVSQHRAGGDKPLPYIYNGATSILHALVVGKTYPVMALDVASAKPLMKASALTARKAARSSGTTLSMA
jgi:hypothetical protein